MKALLAGIEPWRARWNALGRRERRALSLLGGFLLALVFVVLVWMPVEGGLAAARARQPAAQAQLAQIRSQALVVERLRRAPRSAPAADAAAAAEQAAQRHGLRERLKRIDAEGVRTVRIQIEGAPFATVMAWLVDLQQQSGLRAESASFERQSGPGLVNARLVLQAQAR